MNQRLGIKKKESWRERKKERKIKEKTWVFLTLKESTTGSKKKKECNRKREIK